MLSGQKDARSVAVSNCECTQNSSRNRASRRASRIASAAVCVIQRIEPTPLALRRPQTATIGRRPSHPTCEFQLFLHVDVRIVTFSENLGAQRKKHPRILGRDCLTIGNPCESKAAPSVSNTASMTSDEDLAAAFQREPCRDLLDELVRRHLGRVRAVVFPMVLDDAVADDLTQEWAL